MNGLNWFQARDLAIAGHAIRRSTWSKWILKRGNSWFVSDSGSGVEVRRVVQNSDFGRSEFEAKDWTDEAWDGGSYPPCTLVPPSSAPAPSSTGGQGSWTQNGAPCDANGNIPVVSTPISSSGSGGGVIVYSPPSINMNFALTGSLGTPLVPDGGDGTCWITPPSSGVVLAVTVANLFDIYHGSDLYIYIAPPGQDITAPPLAGRFWIAGPNNPTNNPGFLQCGFQVGQPSISGTPPTVFYFGAVSTPNTLVPPVGFGRQAGQDALVSVNPGDVWKARLIYVSAGSALASDPNSHALVAECTMTVPDFCDTSTSAPPEGP